MKRSLFFIFIIGIIIVSGVSGQDEAKRWWRLYITSPESRQMTKYNPELALIRTIKMARHSFYGAFYNISSLEIAEALISAKRRGVDVRLVTENDNFNTKAISHILISGIPVESDDKQGLMHNKFAIIDNQIVWTGSYNLTENGAHRNNNNAIKIYSKDLAYIYLKEFNEMFSHNIYGNKKEYTPFPKLLNKYYVKIGKTNINVYFSPDDDIERIIIKRLHKVKTSIHFMAYSFTSDKIGEEIISKFKQGIHVYGLFEKKGVTSRYSEYTKMKLEGVPVRVDKNKYSMHHKVIIIDKSLVIVGSYNYSKNANNYNDENILIIDDKHIAHYYLDEFNKLYY